jgi:hypothetical protein
VKFCKKSYIKDKEEEEEEEKSLINRNDRVYLARLRLVLGGATSPT